MLLRKIVCVAILSAGLIGCGANRAGKNVAESQDIDSSASIQPMTDFYGENLTPEQQANLLNVKVVYFGYDNSDLSFDDEKTLKAHAKYMLDNPSLTLRVSGHTDERGSREYNIALGERRAKAVERFMIMRGVPAARIVIVSYGKEQPVELGSNEEAWAKNRRAELDYETH